MEAAAGMGFLVPGDDDRGCPVAVWRGLLSIGAVVCGRTSSVLELRWTVSQAVYEGQSCGFLAAIIGICLLAGFASACIAGASHRPFLGEAWPIMCFELYFI